MPPPPLTERVGSPQVRGRQLLRESAASFESLSGPPGAFKRP
jgi:hypothetical protein